MEGTSGLYEIRVEVGSDIYRVFSFFDKGHLIILINGFQKKTPKTPKSEIELAEKLKKEHFNETNMLHDNENTNENNFQQHGNWSEAEIREANSIRQLKNKSFTDEMSMIRRNTN